MNQYGFVELTHIKGEHLYRFIVPMATPWTEVKIALDEMSAEVAKHIEEYEKSQKEQQASAPIEVTTES